MADVARDARDGEKRLRDDVEVLASTKFWRARDGRARREAHDRDARHRREIRVDRPSPPRRRGDDTDDAGAPIPVRSYLFRFAARANAKVDPPRLAFTSDLPKAPPVVPPHAIQAVDGSGTGAIEGELVLAGFGVSTAEWTTTARPTSKGYFRRHPPRAPPVPDKSDAELYELSKFRDLLGAAAQGDRCDAPSPRRRRRSRCRRSTRKASICRRSC